MATETRKGPFSVSDYELKYVLTGLGLAKELALDSNNIDLVDRLGAAAEMLKMVRDGYQLKMKK